MRPWLNFYRRSPGGVVNFPGRVEPQQLTLILCGCTSHHTHSLWVYQLSHSSSVGVPVITLILCGCTSHHLKLILCGCTSHHSKLILCGCTSHHAHSLWVCQLSHSSSVGVPVITLILCGCTSYHTHSLWMY